MAAAEEWGKHEKRRELLFYLPLQERHGVKLGANGKGGDTGVCYFYRLFLFWIIDERLRAA